MSEVKQCLTVAEATELLQGTVADELGVRWLAHLSTCQKCATMVDRLESTTELQWQGLAAVWETKDETATEPECRVALDRIREDLHDQTRYEGRVAGLISESVATLPMEQLGPYRLLEPIGTGGMGVVYRARHLALEKDVALKLLPAHRLHSKSAIGRFQREAKALGRLSHVNIVAASDAGVEQGIPFIAMELVEGCDLNQLLKSAVPFTVPDVCEIGHRIALGLAHAHEQGWVHRDIKPANVMLTPSGEIKILDFGVAVWLRSIDASLTAPGEALGTVEYMAPEQRRSPEEVDARCDAFALGATLYHLIVGSPPFSAKELASAVDRRDMIRTEPIPTLCEGRADLPPEVDSLVRRLLAPDPEERLADMPTIARQLAVHAADQRLLDLASSRGQVQRGRQNSTAETVSAARRCAVAADDSTSVKQTRSLPLRLIAIGSAILLPVVMLGRYVGFHKLTTGSDHAAVNPDSLVTTNPQEEPVVEPRIEWQRGPTRLRSTGLIPAPTAIPGLSRWEVQTVQPHSKVIAHTWNPDGSRYAVGGVSGAIRVYEQREGTPSLIQVFCGPHPSGAMLSAWSPDGRWIVTSGMDRTLHLWNTAAYRNGPEFPMLGAALNALAWDPSSSQFATADLEGRLCLWNVDGSLERTLSASASPISSLIWRSKKLLVGDVDGRVTRWETDSWTDEAVHEFYAPILAMAADPTGSQIAVRLDQVSDVQLLEEAGSVKRLMTPDARLDELTWSDDGRWLAAAGSGIYCWDLESEQTLGKPAMVYDADLCLHLNWIGQGNTLSWYSFGDARLHWENGRQHCQVGSQQVTTDLVTQSRNLVSLSWSPDGHEFAAGGNDGRVYVFSEAGELQTTIPAFRGETGAVVWSPTDPLIAATASWANGGDWTVRIWDRAAGRLSQRLEGHTSGILCADWSPDGRYLATGSGDLTVRVWDTENDSPVVVLEGHTSNIQSVAWNPGGAMLASGAEDRTVRVWKFAEKASFERPILAQTIEVDGPVSSLAWSPDGDFLAVAQSSGPTVLLDAETGRPIWNAPANYRPALIDWNPAGNQLAVGQLGLVDPRSGLNHPVLGTEWAVAYSPNGRRLAATGMSHELTLYTVQDSTLVPDWVAVLDGEEHVQTFSASGEPLFPSQADLDSFVYVCERLSGQMELLTASEFQQRYQSAQAVRNR